MGISDVFTTAVAATGDTQKGPAFSEAGTDVGAAYSLCYTRYNGERAYNRL